MFPFVYHIPQRFYDWTIKCQTHIAKLIWTTNTWGWTKLNCFSYIHILIAILTVYCIPHRHYLFLWHLLSYKLMRFEILYFSDRNSVSCSYLLLCRLMRFEILYFADRLTLVSVMLTIKYKLLNNKCIVDVFSCVYQR